MSQDKKNILDKLINIEAGKSFDKKNIFMNLSNNDEKAAWGNMEDEYEGQLSVDIYESNGNIVARSTIAGAKPEDIEVFVNNDMLTIRGKRHEEEVIDKNNYYCKECYWGGFSRSIILPAPVQIDSISAELKNGVLTVIMPKIKNGGRSIKIRNLDEE